MYHLKDATGILNQLLKMVTNVSEMSVVLMQYLHRISIVGCKDFWICLLTEYIIYISLFPRSTSFSSNWILGVYMVSGHRFS